NLSKSGFGKGGFCRVRKDDDWLFADQRPTAFVVAPDPSAARVCSGTAELLAQRLENLLDPEILVDRLLGPILAGNENYDQGRSGRQRGTKDFRRIDGRFGHATVL